MKVSDISVPEIYKESSDFRFFIEWFTACLQKIQYQHDHLIDLYDCLRCPDELLWLLADTMGFKYEDRLPPAFNRLVLLYFASIIRYKGSQIGVTLAAEANLAQFRVLEDATDDNGKPTVHYSRLEDTSIPVNSVYVNAVTDKNYIDIVYFSEKVPIDACIEYARPLGMYCFQHAGVQMSARSRIHVDARLTNDADLSMSIGPTRVGNYTRTDYAKMQRANSSGQIDPTDRRSRVNYRNTVAEGDSQAGIQPGYRAIYNLQLCNNVKTVKAVMPQVFSFGPNPESTEVANPPSYIRGQYSDPSTWNLLCDKSAEAIHRGAVSATHKVNPDMCSLGDAIQISQTEDSRTYTKVDLETGQLATDTTSEE